MKLVHASHKVYFLEEKASKKKWLSDHLLAQPARAVCICLEFSACYAVVAQSGWPMLEQMLFLFNVAPGQWTKRALLVGIFSPPVWIGAVIIVVAVVVHSCGRVPKACSAEQDLFLQGYGRASASGVPRVPGRHRSSSYCEQFPETRWSKCCLLGNCQ